MPFKKGHKSGGGRKPGSTNKKSAADLIKICDDLGIDPFTELLTLSRSTRDEGIKVACLKECAKYIYPQMRSTEISGPNGQPIQSEVEASTELKEILADLQTIIDTKVNERKG